MTKYREYYLKMINDNPELFENFKAVHDRYALDSNLQEEYNEAGKPIIVLIRDFEDKLCNRSEGSGYGSYTAGLAEKFWGCIREDFPLIDRVGVKITNAQASEPEDEFLVSKIELFNISKIELDSK